jgi:glyoxylase-like metal-dependent hydrolase (beta-lactamase superfamily II)
LDPNDASEAYEVVIVRYGTRDATASEVYLNHHLYGEDDHALGMDYFFWVVRNRDHTVCIDTGFSPDGGAVRGRTQLVDVASAYAAVGVDPAAGPPVVITHAHYDHIGNLGLFPSSHLYLAAAELEFWTGPHRDRRQFHHSVEDVELDRLQTAAAEGRVTLFDDEIEVAPGVRVVRVGGHTPGQSVVHVPTTAGPVLIASDAIHYYEEYERDMPFSSVADLVGMYAGFDTIRSWADAGAVEHIVTGHDPDTLRRFPPLAGLEGTAAVVGQLLAAEAMA